LKPNFAPIFFQLPSPREERGLVPGESLAKPVSEVGGVVGGVMGSIEEGESVSSVRLSGPSADEMPDDPER